MKSNGYINATKMCRDCNKHFKYWNENKQSKNLFYELSSHVGNSTSELSKSVSGGKITKIRGTYVHPKLIIHIASWCSSEYALKVSDIVIEYHAKQALDEKEKMLKKKDDKIDRMSNKIDKLLSENNLQTKKINKLVTENNLQTKKIDRLLINNKKLVKKNDEIYDQNEEIKNKLDAVSNDRVIQGKKQDDHMLIIIKNNDDDNDDDDDDSDTIYDYHALRLMKKSYKQRLVEHQIRHPNMEILMKINYSPNSMRLWNLIRDNVKKIEVSGNKFNLKHKYGEQSLIKDIKRIHDERFNLDNY
jgi:hypothetical protein